MTCDDVIVSGVCVRLIPFQPRFQVPVRLPRLRHENGYIRRGLLSAPFDFIKRQEFSPTVISYYYG